MRIQSGTVILLCVFIKGSESFSFTALHPWAITLIYIIPDGICIITNRKGRRRESTLSYMSNELLLLNVVQK